MKFRAFKFPFLLLVAVFLIVLVVNAEMSHDEKKADPFQVDKHFKRHRGWGGGHGGWGKGGHGGWGGRHGGGHGGWGGHHGGGHGGWGGHHGGGHGGWGGRHGGGHGGWGGHHP